MGKKVINKTSNKADKLKNYEQKRAITMQTLWRFFKT